MWRKHVTKLQVPFRTDPALLMHAVVNLLINAIQAGGGSLSDQHQVTLLLSCNAESNPALPICIKVMDNGIGIPDKLTKKIFEPGVTTKPGGHGLGLAICQTIAHYLGGELTLESVKDPTVFQLLLPLESAKVLDLEEELSRGGR